MVLRGSRRARKGSERVDPSIFGCWLRGGKRARRDCVAYIATAEVAPRDPVSHGNTWSRGRPAGPDARTYSLSLSDLSDDFSSPNNPLSCTAATSVATPSVASAVLSPSLT